ncbi:hypothetical protein GCM10023206_18600 [Acinetobacter puyangensis]
MKYMRTSHIEDDLSFLAKNFDKIYTNNSHYHNIYGIAHFYVNDQHGYCLKI